MTEAQLQVSILEYLSQKVLQLPLDDNRRSLLQQNINGIAQALNIDTQHQKSGISDLFVLFKNSNPPPMPSGESGEESFKKYMELLQKRGYFIGTTEGTPEYESRLEKARTRFFAKFSTDSAQDKGAATTQTTPLPDTHAHLSQEERTSLGDQHKNKGNTLLQENKLIEAIQEYDVAIRYVPNNAIYYANRGYAYQKLSEHQKAIDDCKTALKHDPKYTKAYVRLAQSYINLRDYTTAVKVVEEGLVLEPNNSPLLQLKQEISEIQMAEAGFGLGMGMGAAGAGMGAAGGGGGGAMPGMGGMPGLPNNFMDLMNNPEFMQMAAQLVQDNPDIMNMARQVAQNPQLLQQMLGQMGGSLGGGGAPFGGPPFGGPPPGSGAFGGAGGAGDGVKDE